MITRLLLSLFLLAAGLAAGPVHASCDGRDLIAAMDTERRAALDAAVEAEPYPRGNYWRAQRGDSALTLVGTYHLDDPRHDATMGHLKPMIETADVVLLEAGPEEEARLLAEIARNPSLMFITDGPTLPEMLPEADWQRLAEEMRARQIPPFFAAKFRPWYVSMMLGIPPCAIETTIDNVRGLDKRIGDWAEAKGVPLGSLESFDTVLTMMDSIPEDMQYDMIRSTLSIVNQAADYNATMVKAYFEGNSRMIWEFTREMALDDPTFTPEEVAEQYAVMEEALMASRNRAWIEVIEGASPGGNAFVAFGALHLSGQDGVLALLERNGWSIEALAF